MQTESPAPSPQSPAPNLLLRGAQVINPARRTASLTDILIEGGLIRRIGRNLKPDGAEVWELKGKCISPGFIDLHCHLREPGREDEETIRTGTLAALAGGFTTVCCMPNTTPPIDTENVVRGIINESAFAEQARVLPIGAATKGRAGAEIAEIGAMVRAGAVAVSDDGDPVADAEVMRRVMEYVKVFDIPVISHCEEQSLTRGGVMNEGSVSARLGMPGIPCCAEETMVMRDILLADYTRSRVHIAHVSTKGSVEIIRWAKSRGAPVTCETCPHYFTLTDERVATFDSNCKVNPPLRSRADVEAIKEGLADGTIDCIATDHAPHLASEKEVEFERAPSGMIGFETAFALGVQELVKPKVLSLNDLLARITVAPARILKLERKIAVGAPADLTIFDPDAEWEYSEAGVRSGSRNSPFIGQTLTGKIVATIVGARAWRF